jgi:hypothetical protein
MKPTFPLEEIYEFILHREHRYSIKFCIWCIRCKYTLTLLMLMMMMIIKKTVKKRFYSLQARLFVRFALRSTRFLQWWCRHQMCIPQVEYELLILRYKHSIGFSLVTAQSSIPTSHVSVSDMFLLTARNKKHTVEWEYCDVTQSLCVSVWVCVCVCVSGNAELINK